MKATKQDLRESGRPLTKEEFIQKIKENDEFSNKWGDLGPIYGKQWRSWRNPKFTKIAKELSELWDGRTHTELDFPIDQIANLINDLKTNPDSRRLMVSAWNVGELDSMTLPPCHYGFQVYTREISVQERKKYDKYFDDLIGEYPDHHITLDKRGVPRRAISLMWNQRSVDTFLGLPFNIASYGLLLEIIAKTVNMVPDELIGNLGDTHLYSNHIEQAKEQIGRELSLKERYDIHKDYINSDKLDLLFELATDENLDKLGVPRRTREPYPLPTLNINTEFWQYEGGECGIGPLDAAKVFESFKDENFCRCLLEEDIQLGNYQSHPSIKAPISN